MPNASRSFSSDRSLLVELHRGEEDAATKLYLRYAERLRALALRQTAGDLRSRVDPEDIVQSVFRTFFRRAAVGHYQVPEGEELWKLFLVIALNKIRSTGAKHHAAKRDARATQSAEALAEQPATDETSLTILNLVIEEMLADMPESTRQIIKLRIAGHEVEEIARQVDRSKRSVERVLQDFRTQLGKSLTDQP
ncbi:MAG TPA: sigma-70 family RNA polymerase sigma factor [Gemmatales bacterium]|nr:sigma-70 family RNA polymerase sigma factor [Gemmatales bacterium]